MINHLHFSINYYRNLTCWPRINKRSLDLKHAFVILVSIVENQRHWFAIRDAKCVSFWDGPCVDY